VVYGKSLNFALRIVKAYQYLSDEKGERILSKQLLRSGTAIGAMVCEAEFAESANDFIHKLHIALKEANETAYWLLLLYKSDYIDAPSYESINQDAKELIKLLVCIIKTSKENNQKKMQAERL
uniref:four helix bundle protein n=1 Tax=Phocaeicola sp. TaxID=2773926 RepID=UPI003A95CB7C